MQRTLVMFDPAKSSHWHVLNYLFSSAAGCGRSQPYTAQSLDPADGYPQFTEYTFNCRGLNIYDLQ